MINGVIRWLVGNSRSLLLSLSTVGRLSPGCKNGFKKSIFQHFLSCNRARPGNGTTDKAFFAWNFPALVGRIGRIDRKKTRSPIEVYPSHKSHNHQSGECPFYNAQLLFARSVAWHPSKIAQLNNMCCAAYKKMKLID